MPFGHRRSGGHRQEAEPARPAAAHAISRRRSPHRHGYAPRRQGVRRQVGARRRIRYRHRGRRRLASFVAALHGEGPDPRPAGAPQSAHGKVHRRGRPQPVRIPGELAIMNRIFCALALAALAHGADGGWPSYNGDTSGRRYSPLAQINQKNVGSLTLAWMAQMRSVDIKSTPLMVNGILYFTTPDNVWAMDARTGRTIWHYQRESQGDHIGQRGVGMYKDWLYFETPDCHLISLDARNGKMRWDVELADPKLGYFATMAPLIIKDHVLAGVSGDVTDVPGFLDARDPDTGKLQWRWYTEPKPGEPGSETWPQGTDAIAHGGGMTWMTGTYDPGLNLTYWGIGNPNPVLNGDQRKGDDLYTCSIVALDPETGKLKWHFQPSPHDTHDWDAVQTPVLFDDVKNGVRRKLLAQASRNGYFFVLDRSTGEHVLTKPFTPTNWSSGTDRHGQPRPLASKEPKPDGVLVSPGSDGATNWMAPSYDPDFGMFYLSARDRKSVV